MKGIFKVIIVCLTLVVFSFQTSIAAEELLICDAEPTRMTIDYGDRVECEITPALDIDFYYFNGTKDELAILSLLDRTSGCGSFGNPCPVAYLYTESDNSTPILTIGPGTDTKSITLPESGKYTLRVKESGDNQAESYRIALERLFPESPTALTIWWAEQVDDTIDPAPDQDFYLFDGYKDDLIQMSLLDLTSGCGSFGNPCPVAYLYDPSRNLVDSLGPGNQSKAVTLPENGTYTFYLAESGQNQTESYRLALECIAGECEEELANPLTCRGRKATIIGTADDNVIIGTDGNDVIVGLGGNDIIYGLKGADRICGGYGDDTIYGGLNGDRLYGDAGNDILRGGGSRDFLFGNTGNDTLDGGSWHDVLDGGSGNDTLYGAGADDELRGNTGLDVCDGGAHYTGDTADASCEAIINVENLP